MMSQTENEPSVSDRRTQTRIQIQTPIKVTLPGSDKAVTALNQDISWGGALFIISMPLPEQTGSMRIDFPWKRGEYITAEARLLRAKPLEDGR